MNQQNYCRRILFITNVYLLFVVGTLYAQSSENYRIKKAVIDQGGDLAHSANYRVTDFVGQSSAVCTTTSENHTVFSGFLGGYKYSFTGIDENIQIVVPEESELLQNYPNPFNPVTHIEYSLEQEADVELTIFDIQGNTVSQLVKGNKSAGYYTAVWDGKNLAGETVATGMYFYRISMRAKSSEQQAFTSVKKMILMK